MKKIMLIAATAALLAGCDTMNTVERSARQSVPNIVADKRIITDTSLDQYAFVSAINEGRTPQGLLRIQAEIANTTSDYKNVNYKFEWFDKNGMIVESPASPWKDLSIEGGERRYVTGVAPNADVVDFRLKLFPNVRN